MKRILGILLSLAMLLVLTACSDKASVPSVGYNAKDNDDRTSDADNRSTELTVWCAEEDQEFIAERVEVFKTSYPDRKFQITVSSKPESTAVDAILADIRSAADIYAFTSNDLTKLVDAGALLALDDSMSAILTEYVGKSLDDVKASNNTDSVDSASIDGTMYAFPMGLNDNGYIYIGVNPHVQNAGWAVALAEFLTDDESQIAHFNVCQLPPTNVAAAASIQSSAENAADDIAK